MSDKIEVVISKQLLKLWLQDNPIIKHTEFSRMSKIGSLTTHFFMDQYNWSHRTLLKVASVAVKYGYLNWYGERNFSVKELESFNAVTVDVTL